MGCKSSTEVSPPVVCCPMDDTSTSLTTGINEVEVDLSHFSKSKELLGLGGFGMVRRMTKTSGHDIGREYAIKSMSKAMILSRNSGPTAVMTELRTLIILDDSEYICRIHYAFQDKEHLYMILDYAAGGDLRYCLRKSILLRFSEGLARMVIHQVFLALQHCHEHNILHRDVKPENILLKADGRVILSDFGVAKILPNIERCQATSGTHGYMAPEIYVSDHTHGTTFDWFCVGVTLHELLTGRRPFEAVKLQRYYQSAGGSPLLTTGGTSSSSTSKREKLTLDVIFQYKLSTQCLDFMKSILEPNPKKRIGSHEGIIDIYQHPWMLASDFVPPPPSQPSSSPSRSSCSSLSSMPSSCFNSPNTSPSRLKHTTTTSSNNTIATTTNTATNTATAVTLLFPPNSKLISTLIHELPFFQVIYQHHLDTANNMTNQTTCLSNGSNSAPISSSDNSVRCTGNRSLTSALPNVGHHHNGGGSAGGGGGNQISKLHVSKEEALAMIQQHQQSHVITEEVQKVFKHFEYNTRHPMMLQQHLSSNNSNGSTTGAMLKRSTSSFYSANSSQGATTVGMNSSSLDSRTSHPYPSLLVQAQEHTSCLDSHHNNNKTPLKPMLKMDPHSFFSHDSNQHGQGQGQGAVAAVVAAEQQMNYESDMDSCSPYQANQHQQQQQSMSPGNENDNDIMQKNDHAAYASAKASFSRRMQGEEEREEAATAVVPEVTTKVVTFATPPHHPNPSCTSSAASSVASSTSTTPQIVPTSSSSAGASHATSWLHSIFWKPSSTFSSASSSAAVHNNNNNNNTLNSNPNPSHGTGSTTTTPYQQQSQHPVNSSSVSSSASFPHQPLVNANTNASVSSTVPRYL